MATVDQAMGDHADGLCPDLPEREAYYHAEVHAMAVELGARVAIDMCAEAVADVTWQPEVHAMHAGLDALYARAAELEASGYSSHALAADEERRPAAVVMAARSHHYPTTATAASTPGYAPSAAGSSVTTSAAAGLGADSA